MRKRASGPNIPLFAIDDFQEPDRLYDWGLQHLARGFGYQQHHRYSASPLFGLAGLYVVQTTRERLPATKWLTANWYCTLPSTLAPIPDSTAWKPRGIIFWFNRLSINPEVLCSQVEWALTVIFIDTPRSMIHFAPPSWVVVSNENLVRPLRKCCASPQSMTLSGCKPRRRRSCKRRQMAASITLQ